MSSFATIAYADCFSGISGDMFLSALLHCGLDETILKDKLSLLNLGNYTLSVNNQTLGSISCKTIHITTHTDQQHRNLQSIRTLLESSHLPATVIEKAINVFTELARAEAKVHGCAIDAVHFHEVGALDSIIDVVGVLIGLEELKIGKLYVSSLPMARGFVSCDHGILPLPAPAVCEILKDVPLYGVELQQELVTPTGAALIKVLAADFGPMPPMHIQTTGYGAGSQTLSNKQPNLLRLIIGQQIDVNELQEVEVIETNLDDWSPEGFPHVCDLLLSQGALDVSLAPIQMKKGRPAFLLQVIAPAAHSLTLKQTILSETSAIGLRFRKENRLTLPREMVEIQTQWGAIAAKKVITPTATVIYPEYEACREVAKRFKVPLQQVYAQVKKQA